jgi:hypothetical protein
MNKYVADDFDEIRKRQQELFAKPEPETPKEGHKWNGSPDPGCHCSHCPWAQTDTCPETCRSEAIRKGLIADGADWPPGGEAVADDGAYYFNVWKFTTRPLVLGAVR